MNRLLGWILVAFLSLPTFASPTPPQSPSHENPQGKVFAPDSNRAVVLFNFDWTQAEEQTPQGKVSQFKCIYRNPEGTEAVTEEATLLNGQFVSYRLSQYQTREQSIVERKGDKLIFRHGPMDKPLSDLKYSEEKWDDRFSIGPMLVPQLQAKWNEILAGGKLELRMGVPDRRETIGFTLTKHAEQNDRIVIMMKPTNFLISALVKPMYFEFSKDGSKILTLRGRALPKLNKNGKWKDLDADIAYYVGSESAKR